LDPFGIYLWQTDQHRAMYFHIPSVWMFVGGDCDRLESYAVAMTMMILGIGLYLVMSGKKKLDNREDFVGFACWIHWTCTLYLPWRARDCDFRAGGDRLEPVHGYDEMVLH
jgi:hypothetical protein